MFYRLSLTKALCAAAVMAAFIPGVQAEEANSGYAVKYAVQGNLGEVLVNPYKIAPLTAIIRLGGYEVSDVTVRIVPKEGGQEIKYKVSDVDIRTHSGIPVFGLYPDYVNTVETTYTRHFQGFLLAENKST